MKFTVSSSKLLTLLQATGRVISTKNSLPILDYFLFELTNNQLNITASDLETTMIGTLEVDQVEHGGLVAVPSKLLLDSLKEFSEQPLTFDVNESSSEIIMSWQRGKLSLPGASGVNYPSVQTLEGEGIQRFTIESDLLLNAISKTLFAAGDDEMRPVMNGIYVNLEPQSATFVATDAHKLVKYNVKNPACELAASFILAKKPANLLRNILPKNEDDVTVEFDAKNVQFRLSNYTLLCRLIEGNYPNYNAVIPLNNPNHVIVDRSELMNVIRRVAVCSDQATNLIKMDVSAEKTLITAQDVDFSVSAHEELPCNYQGAPMSIGFKSTFLVEILNNLESQSVQIELADSSRAGVFRPVESNSDEELLMLLMPMMIG